MPLFPTLSTGKGAPTMGQQERKDEARNPDSPSCNLSALDRVDSPSPARAMGLLPPRALMCLAGKGASKWGDRAWSSHLQRAGVAPPSALLAASTQRGERAWTGAGRRMLRRCYGSGPWRRLKIERAQEAETERRQQRWGACETGS